MTHEFHFKLDIGTLVRLRAAGNCKKARDLSKFIVEVCHRMYLCFKRTHLLGERLGSRYEFISADRKEKRKSVHVHMPIELYNHIKLMHQELNRFSMAQLLRKFLRLFLELLIVHDTALECFLRAQLKELNVEKSKVIQELRHMSKVLTHINQDEVEYAAFYNSQYIPVKRLNL